MYHLEVTYKVVVVVDRKCANQTSAFFLLSVLVHNKVDLADECQRVKRASGEEIAKRLKISFHTTSVMRDQGVNEVFKRLGKRVVYAEMCFVFMCQFGAKPICKSICKFGTNSDGATKFTMQKGNRRYGTNIEGFAGWEAEEAEINLLQVQSFLSN